MSNDFSLLEMNNFVHIVVISKKVITFATDHSPLRGLDPTFGQS